MYPCTRLGAWLGLESKSRSPEVDSGGPGQSPGGGEEIREVRKVVALSGGLGESGSPVGRVRDLLADFNEETGLPRDASASLRLSQARERGTFAGDLDEIENRLERLKVSFPDLVGVEVNPLVLPARAYLASGNGRGPKSPHDSRPSTRTSRGMGG